MPDKNNSISDDKNNNISDDQNNNMPDEKRKVENQKKNNTIVCYMLTNESLKLTYIGYTTNLNRRIRQHRRYIKGGAKYTKRFKRCNVLVFLSGFPNKRIAMSYEWWAKRRRIRIKTHAHTYTYKNKDHHKHKSQHDPRRNVPICQWPHRRVQHYLAPLLLPKFRHVLHNLTLYLSAQHFSQTNTEAMCEVIRTYYSIKGVQLINK